MKKLVINTKAWTRDTFCDENGKCCAIGFLAKQILIKKGKKPDSEDIWNKANGLSIPNRAEIIHANDNLNGQKRREALKQAFKKIGYQVIFK